MPAFSDVGIPQLFGAALVAVLAGGLKGFTGFGGALVMTPFFVAVYGPRFAVPLIVLLESGANLLLVRTAWARAERRRSLLLATVCLASTPLGVWLLVTVPPDTLTPWIHSAVLVASGVLALVFYYQGRPDDTARPTRSPSADVATGVGASIVSGVCAGAAGLGGPALVLFMVTRGGPAERARANIVVVFSLVGLGLIASYASQSLFTADILRASALLAPLLFAATWAGAHSFRRSNHGAYRWVAILVLAAGAVWGLFS